MTRATVRRHATALLLVPALALTACGGEDGEGGDTAPLPAASTSPGTAPSPAASSPTSSTETETGTGTAASTATATPGGGAAGHGSRRPAAPTVTPSAYRTLASCLERHGVELPDPGQATAPPPGFDPFKAQEALKNCMKDLEKPRGASAPR